MFDILERKRIIEEVFENREIWMIIVEFIGVFVIVFLVLIGNVIFSMVFYRC